MMKLLSIRKIYTTFILCVCLPFTAQAQVIVTETQPLSFGTFAFGNFASVLTINIQNNGGFNQVSNAVIITPPTRSEYDLDAGIANANTAYSITTPLSINLTGPGGNFIIDNFRVRPLTLVTDATGFDQFRIVARISSLGGGTLYGNGLYNDDFDIIITF